ncbi:hypothetical protein J2T04_002991 [Chryseobacterium lathyri]|uniref:Uncharacterized protein n=1 Tax=Chryseobacterium lathyri TaxID=395933 RepID=A0ABT9SP95_9FLAO|nr:hypothetical protein [Chryseobacterium lathyri]
MVGNLIHSEHYARTCENAEGDLKEIKDFSTIITRIWNDPTKVITQILK